MRLGLWRLPGWPVSPLPPTHQCAKRRPVRPDNCQQRPPRQQRPPSNTHPPAPPGHAEHTTRMFPTDILLTYLAACTLVVVSPGPDIILAVSLP